MTNTNTDVETFVSLHQPGNPLILFNIWDAGSAKIVAAAGAKAIASGSYAVAGAQGFDDGEQLPFDCLCRTARQIVAAVAVPVTIDIESGYGETVEQVAAAARALRDIGVTGVNIEDARPGGGGLRDETENAERIAAVAETGLFVNARTDVFRDVSAESHDMALADAAIARCAVYKQAGAGSLFVPFLSDRTLIAAIADAAVLPLNIMVLDEAADLQDFAGLGVARISLGPKPWLDAMQFTGASARQYLAQSVGHPFS